MLSLVRVATSDKGTFGVLTQDGLPLCVTCEDPWNDNKRGVSCIPAGEYDVHRHNWERSNNYKYKQCWHVVAVPGRSAILIHAGNTIQDTRGCILVGNRYGTLGDLPAVLSSRDTLNVLRETLPERFRINIVWGDGV